MDSFARRTEVFETPQELKRNRDLSLIDVDWLSYVASRSSIAAMDGIFAALHTASCRRSCNRTYSGKQESHSKHS